MDHNHDMHARHGGARGAAPSAAMADKHEGHSIEMFKNKFWLSLVLSIAVVLYSGILDVLFGFTAPPFPGSDFIPLVLGTAVFFYGGWVFVTGAYRELKARQPGMMTLVAMAISVAYAYSLYSFFFARGETLFWELASLITIMLLGHWMEMRAVQGARGALKALAKLLPDTAEIVKEGKTETVPLGQLKTGDVILVRPGGKIAADGTIAEGRSEVNESMVTGESKPVFREAGDPVIAGTVNGDGSLKIKVDKIGEGTFLSGVMKLVAQAQNSRSRLQMLSDKAAYYLTVIALISGGLTFIVWTGSQAGADFALERTVAVLVIACPHALGLAIPLVASISTGMAAKNGLLVKQRLALEAARNINVVLFDKTGTLTKGEYGIERLIGSFGGKPELVLKLAASVNANSEHPIAKAIMREAAERNIFPSPAADFQRLPGKGAKAVVEGREVLVGSAALLEESGAGADGRLAEQASRSEKQGKTVIFVIADKKLVGSIALADVIREESREAVRSLKDMGIRVAMVTGDSEDVASWVAGELKIDQYFARVLPEQKAKVVRDLQEGAAAPALGIPSQKRGSRLSVGMVGDGINDAPALAQADLGIAIGAGTNVAVESAGIILVKNDPRDIPKVIKLSRLTYSKMIQNLFWATGYNAVALPLAAGVLAAKGIFLQPALAAVLMSLSTIIVAINAAMLRRQGLS